MMRRVIEVGIVAAVVAVGGLSAGRIGFQDVPRSVPFALEDFFIAPVRVHLIRLKGDSGVGTDLTKDDVDRIFRKANGIWHSAGIHLWVESIREERPASGSEGAESGPITNMRRLVELRPKASLADGMFHVYYVGKTAINGLYVYHDAIFVQESAKLDIVPGGIDEPLPRVTAHEIGHGFRLKHRQARTNLMASGTTGTSLNGEEVHTARRAAEMIPWIGRAETFLAAAENMTAKGDRADVASRLRAILALPGESPLKTRAAAALTGDPDKGRITKNE